MDKHSAHISKETVAFMERNGVRYIINIPSAPNQNCIESVFSKVKKIYKRRRLQSLTNPKSKEFDMDKEIKYAFKQVKIKDVKGYARLSFAYIYG